MFWAICSLSKLIGCVCPGCPQGHISKQFSSLVNRSKCFIGADSKPQRLPRKVAKLYVSSSFAHTCFPSSYRYIFMANKLRINSQYNMQTFGNQWKLLPNRPLIGFSVELSFCCPLWNMCLLLDAVHKLVCLHPTFCVVRLYQSEFANCLFWQWLYLFGVLGYKLGLSTCVNLLSICDLKLFPISLKPKISMEFKCYWEMWKDENSSNLENWINFYVKEK